MENYFSKHNSLFFLLFFAVLFPQTSWALRPYSSRMALVAGTTSPGFQDGDFLTSTFNRPLGITINPDGTELFISDTDNNRIRIVHLDQKNNVTTLSGGRQAGNQNGSLTEARFSCTPSFLGGPCAGDNHVHEKNRKGKDEKVNS